MFSFLFRIARRAARVQKHRFLALIFTLTVASSLLIILSTLYLNAESQLALQLSGVPNMVIKPSTSPTQPASLTADDVSKLKSGKNFWRNNVITATPVMQTTATKEGKVIPVAGTWFSKKIQQNKNTYSFGILTFDGWMYNGRPPTANEVVVGAHVDVSDQITLQINDSTRTFQVAGRINTGSYLDNYVFVPVPRIQSITGRKHLDKILVSTLIKPKDRLAIQVEKFGRKSLTKEEFEEWSCSPYPNSIAYSISKVYPNSRVRIQRGVTAVQERVIKASGNVLLYLLILTLVAAVLAIFSAQKVYINAHMSNYGIMMTLGATKNKLLLLPALEILLASLLSAAMAFGISKALLEILSRQIFHIPFQTDWTLLIVSLLIPLAIAFIAFALIRKDLKKDVVNLLYRTHV